MSEDFIREIVESAIRDAVSEAIEKECSDEEVKNLISSENISKIWNNLLEEASNDSIDVIENIMYEKVFEDRNLSDEFIARQNQKWGKAFVASEAMYLCVLESAGKYNEYVQETYKGKVSALYHALRIIHGKAMQVYLEILCLNKNGFADGAYARWRSLYELSIISAFVFKYGEKVAESFIKSADTDDRYEWARVADCFKSYNKKYVTFSAIQSNCEIATKEWKKEYSFVNQLVHASPQGTVYRLCGDTSKIIPVGRSDWGMSISAVHSAISLSEITSDFFSVFPHGDSIVAMASFHKWVEKIDQYYKEVEKECFCEDDTSDL